MLFEHLVFNQIVHSAAAQDMPVRLASYRTEHGAEVDFILEWKGEVWAVEVKASSQIRTSDLRGLASFADYYKKRHRPVVVYLGSALKRVGKIDVFPWLDFLKEASL